MDVVPPKPGMIDTWLKKHTLIHTGATRHPFILAIRDGTVDISAFKRWLSQDYIFVRAFVPFAASLVVKGWKNSDDSDGDVEVILSGLAALNDEIDWFKKQASKWGVDLSVVAPQQPALDYCRFLENLTSPEVEYTVAMTAYWAIEAVYQESFAHCLEEGFKTRPELQEVCHRWGNDGFGSYCSAIRSIADRLLLKASDDEVRKAEVTFLRVLEYEVEFWNMSRGIPRY
ncbi:PREDICTED: seed maturation protein PM36 [Fragaria vesca subsp. vesca]|uniref:seed maturation protein PM36 n=1 Tax=Fragaria vesca subsp. vesca TaxID=101020 RepID=UPI0002C33739|nr:PREDICTED: seed maturation protein PM36 [Fragaria vesca subsp. vesca]